MKLLLLQAFLAHHKRFRDICVGRVGSKRPGMSGKKAKLYRYGYQRMHCFFKNTLVIINRKTKGK